MFDIPARMLVIGKTAIRDLRAAREARFLVIKDDGSVVNVHILHSSDVTADTDGDVIFCCHPNQMRKINPRVEGDWNSNTCVWIDDEGLHVCGHKWYEDKVRAVRAAKSKGRN